MTSDLDTLAERLREIERRPLATRSAEFAAVHDELQSALEAGDSAPSDA